MMIIVNKLNIQKNAQKTSEKLNFPLTMPKKYHMLPFTHKSYVE